MRSIRNIAKLALIAGLATVAMGTSAEARHVRPNAQQTAHQQLIRSLKQQQQLSLISVRLSAISQLQGLNFQRNHGLISRSTYLADRASLITNFHLAMGQMRNLVMSETHDLHALSFEVRTGQISIAQYTAQAQQVISASHAAQLALIAKVQQGLINPTTPFS